MSDRENLRRLDAWLSGLSPTQRWLLAVAFVEAVLSAALVLRRLLK